MATINEVQRQKQKQFIDDCFFLSAEHQHIFLPSPTSKFCRGHVSVTNVGNAPWPHQHCSLQEVAAIHQGVQQCELNPNANGKHMMTHNDAHIIRQSWLNPSKSMHLERQTIKQKLQYSILFRNLLKVFVYFKKRNLNPVTSRTCTNTIFSSVILSI